jgi:hypothetical protein
MVRKARVLMVAMAALFVASCAETAKIDAAGDIHAFLISIRDGDRAAFNAHVDRAALKTQIRARIMAEGARRGDRAGEAALIGVLLGGGLVDSLSDRLIQPDVFRAVADYLGYRTDTPLPNPLVIAGALRTLDGGDVCAARGKAGPCILVFRNEDGTWKLIGFDGDVSMLRPPKRL